MPENGAREAGKSRKLMSPKGALSIANSVLGGVLGTFALIFVAQNMGPEVLGVLAFALASVGILSFLSDFGAGSVHVREIRKGADVGKCVGAYAIIRLTLLVIFAVISIVLIELWKRGYVGDNGYGNEVLADSLYVFLIYYVLLGITQIGTHTFDALDQSAKVYVPQLLEVTIRISLMIYISLSTLGGTPEAPALLASAYGIGIVCSALLVSYLVRNLPMAMPDRKILVTYIRSFAPVFLVTMILVFDLYLDKVVVGSFWGFEELGLYFGAQKMAIFVSIFSMSVATMILPSLTAYHYRRDLSASWHVVSQAERYVSLIVVPIAAFYIFYSRDILRELFGELFVPAVDTMNVLVLASALLALVLPLRSVIASVGRPSILFWIGAGGIALELLLMVVFVPESFLGIDMFGLKGFGAAMAILVGSMFYFGAFRIMVWRTSRILPTTGIFKHLLCAAMMLFTLYIVDLLLPRVDLIALVLQAIVGLVSYATAAYLMGELKRSDYRKFREMLNPSETLGYVVHELLGKRSQ
ncbi:MAG TPA: oligosaccharide flippase family protein [Thermoplasmata archaeon]